MVESANCKRDRNGSFLPAAGCVGSLAGAVFLGCASVALFAVPGICAAADQSAINGIAEVYGDPSPSLAGDIPVVAKTATADESVATDIDGSAGELPTALSINLCADQLLLLLAEPGQIAALSSLSREAAGSYFHERAGQYPQADPRAEDILPIGPDVVLTGPYTSRYTLSLLDELGVKVETLDIAESVESMIDNIRRVGRVLHQQARSEQVVASLQEQLSQIDQRVADYNARLQLNERSLPRAAVYDANGYTVGPDSLRGEAMTRAGWLNVASERGVASYGALQLEDMIRLDPDALIESPYSQHTYSRAQALPTHPALRMAGIEPMIISLPSNETICAGPWLVDVIERLVDAREALLSHGS